MPKLYNLARVTTSTVGVDTIVLGAAARGCLTFALAGVVSGETVSYGISDGTASEVGRGVYTEDGLTLTRNPITSTNGNSAISLSGMAEVYITALAQDIPALPVEYEIDFGNKPCWSAEFTITDAACTATSKVMVVPSGNVATDRTGNDWVWDTVVFAALPGVGSFTLSAIAIPGPVTGKRKILYTIN